MYSGYLLALALLLLAMLNIESVSPTPGNMLDLKSTEQGKPKFGMRGGEESCDAQFLVQMGFLTLLPLFAGECLEFGLHHAASSLIRQRLSLRLLYTLSTDHARAFVFDHALQLGSASCVTSLSPVPGLTP